MEPLPSEDLKLSRRRLLQWMGGLSALLTTPGCVRQPQEYLIPYARMPENIVPGQPLFYATAMPCDGYGIGLLAKTHLGRPIKMEGNPEHPASLGATDALAQASVLSLYDPERARSVTHHGSVSSWAHFEKAVRTFLQSSAGRKEGNLRVILPPESSPTVLNLIQKVRQDNSGIVWHQIRSLPEDGLHRAASRLIGRPVEALYDFSRADVVVSFDSDILTLDPGRLRYARELTMRRGEERSQDLNRIYSIHTSPSLLSAYADHRMSVSVAELHGALTALAHALGVDLAETPTLKPELQKWIEALAVDLRNRRGRSLVLLDAMERDDLHELALQINARLGNMGQTLLWQDSVLAAEGITWASEESLVTDLRSGSVQGIILLGVNPLYHSPYAPLYREHLPRLAFSAQLSPYFDETSALCQWHIPQKHYLETWGDIAAFNGLISVIQPTIAPLFASQSILGSLQALIPGSSLSDYDRVRGYWETQRGASNTAREWQSWLNQGFIPGTERNRIAWKEPTWNTVQQSAATVAAESGIVLDLILKPDPSIGDGQMANNPWLQELPKPFTKLTWDHALLMNSKVGASLSIRTGDQVELKLESGKVTVPVLLLETHPEATATLSLGYGHDQPGHLCSGIGVNSFQLRRPNDPWKLQRVDLQKIPARPVPLAQTQTHFQEYRDQHLVRIGNWQAFLENPELFKQEHRKTPTMEPTIPVQVHKVLNKPEDPLQWGMAIDTSTCIGCNACVVACQAENNIPVVGKEEVMNSREMHWLRIDHYVAEGHPDSDVTFQPVPCMHCETAPCEVVCPVAATSHSGQGLNQMVYNRCVGTRYCSNNCPYKVRHFNFYDYVPVNSLTNLQHNPDVTVRSRGVMEKCTYCIQRISNARIEATREGRNITEAEVQPACAQACPTRAISFGNIKDEGHTATRWKKSKRNYELLGELNTKPRTTYLAHLKNFNALLRKLKP
jgi:molybdopterin-containing oxidoreductase family iron-sulfur binding subunit